MSEAASSIDLAYALPAPRHGAKVWAAAVIIGAGLALVVLGGCFLIGVMITMNVGPMGPTPGQPGGVLAMRAYIFLGLLYVLGFGCFGWAATLSVSGLKNLYRILRAT